MASNNMTNDEILAIAEEERQQALASLNSTYNPMISNADKYYEDQIQASKDWAETQTKNQQAQTDFAIEKIEQQKDQTKKDYTKEQSGAYVDWQKQSGDYGVNAEVMAAQGMKGTGYAESSQVSMYNTYQNRVATAREAYTRAVLNYDNAIKDAVLQNNVVLAEIAATALEQQLQIALEAFQYKNSMILAKASAAQSINSDYWSVYQQIENENAATNEAIQEVSKKAATVQTDNVVVKGAMNGLLGPTLAANRSGGGNTTTTSSNWVVNEAVKYGGNTQEGQVRYVESMQKRGQITPSQAAAAASKITSGVR